MRRIVLGLALTVAVTAGLTGGGCATDANDVDGCRQLEFARCERAQGCGIDLAYPLHTGDSPENNINACKQFYQDACLHGLQTSITVTATDLNGCLSAIEKGDCNTVINPVSNSACVWLIPPDAGSDVKEAAVVDVVVAVDTTVTTPVDAVTTPTVDANTETDAGCIANCEALMCPGDEDQCYDICAPGC